MIGNMENMHGDEMSARKNGYYIYFGTTTEFLGVQKKIDNQVKILNMVCDCRKIVVPREEGNVIKSIMWRIPFGSFGRRYEYAFDQIRKNGEPDFLYIRFAPFDRKFIRFLAELRRRYGLAKIMLEIPTYPYKGELLHDITMVPFYFKDVFHRHKVKRYVDRIVTLTDDRLIYGIPTIHIMNGIIVDDIPMVSCGNESERGGVNLIAVALMRRAHGYERCIQGLARYYQKNPGRRVEIHFVGDGEEKDYYQNLASQLHLEEYVFFYGSQAGKELDLIYDKADAGLGFFGLYKDKMSTISSLKSVEYLAKGLPVISGCVEDVMKYEGGKRFFKIFPNDESVIDMEQVIDFYDSICDGSNKGLHEEIREFAKKTVDMSVVMKPVINYILGEKDEK